MKAKELVNGLAKCSSCEEYKPLIDFYKSKQTTLNITSNCKDCIKYINKRLKYSISRKEYEDLLKSQNYVCKICGRTEAESSRFVVDHCHTTKNIRGILCINCNLGIGNLGDDPQRVRNVLGYLLASEPSSSLEKLGLVDEILNVL